MPFPVFEREEALAAVSDSSQKIVDLLRSVRAPEEIAVGHWTTRDVAVHIGHIYSLFPKLVEGGSSPIADHRKIGETWDRLVKEDDERNLEVITDRIERGTKEFINVATNDAWVEEVAWHGGIPMPVYVLAAILMNEAEIHGLDIASAEGTDWKIEPRRAALIVQGILPLLPHFLDEDAARGFSATFELKIRRGTTVYLTVSGGNLSVDVQPRRVDCHMSVDPVEYLLIGYGRKGQWGPALTGKIVTWGRKPWLALKLGRLFDTP